MSHLRRTLLISFQYVTLSVFFISCAQKVNSFSATQKTIAESTSSTTLYFYYDSGISQDKHWSTQTNWWLDSAHTKQATRLPKNGDSVQIVNGSEIYDDIAPTLLLHGYDGRVPNNYASETANISIDAGGTLNITGGYWFGSSDSSVTATFTGVAGVLSAANAGTIHGNAIFNESSYNMEAGVVMGNATFNHDGANINGASVQGDAVFNDNSRNAATIGGNAIFNDNSYNADTVTGTAKFNYVSTDTMTLTSSMAWGNVGAAVNSSDTPILHWIFNDSSKSQGLIPGDAVFNNNSAHNGTYNGPLTFNGSATCGGTINGDATFKDNSAATGCTISGTATFYDNSVASTASITSSIFYNSSYLSNALTGDAVFYDTTLASGTISGNATFFNNTHTNASIGGTAVFYDSSYLDNQGHANGLAEFHGTSECRSGATANSANFYDSIQNYCSIATDATFNDSSQNNSSVTGNATFNGASYNSVSGTYGSCTGNSSAANGGC